MFTINNHWDTGKEQDVLNESLFGTVNQAKHLLADSVGDEISDVDKGWKKKKKKIKKVDVMAISECKKLKTFNADNISSHGGHSNKKYKEKYNIIDPDKDMEDKNTKPSQCMKRKEKRKKLDVMVKVELGKPPKCISVEDKMSSNNVCDDNIKLDIDVGLEKSKVNKKKKKRKKATIEPLDDTSTCNISENRNVSTLNNDKIQENTDHSTDIGNLTFAVNDNNSPLVPPSKKIKRQDTSKYNKFQKKIVEKLKGGQFRWINEKLYSCKSTDAVNMFVTDPKLFDVYHSGFHAQVQQWPQNPVDVIIQYVKSRDNKFVVADFGCGDAKIASSVPNKVHSFDLVAVNERVTACDMKKVPLPGNSIDIAVFCLSLMGTNLVDFLTEAHRVIKIGGILKIAEVKSRFDDADKFNKDVSSIGFSLVEKDDSNKMFILLEFQKSKEVPSKRVSNITLNPCIYKRR